MPFTIRAALADDEHEITDLWRACGLVVSYNDPGQDFRFALSGDSSTVLIALDEADRIVGSTMVGHDGHRGWLYYVAAAPGAQGQGIGRQMVQATENWLRDRGIWKAQLLVRDTNTQVVAFYEHLGFEIAPRVVMSKVLR